MAGISSRLAKLTDFTWLQLQISAFSGNKQAEVVEKEDTQSPVR